MKTRNGFRRSTRTMGYIAAIITLFLVIAQHPVWTEEQVQGVATQSKAVAENSVAIQKAVQTAFSKGDAAFIKNVGQWSAAEIRYALDTHGINVGLTDQGPRFQIFQRKAAAPPSSTPASPDPKDEDTSPAFSMHEFSILFDGAAQVSPQGRAQTTQTYNYLTGPSEQHAQNVPAFQSVWYEGLYQGIDLELIGHRAQLKYNFHVAPGADPNAIRIRYDNVAGITLNTNGALTINIAEDWKSLNDSPPYCYQVINGKETPVAAQYNLLDNYSYGFSITGTYDPTLPLVIDPEIVWGSYIGGNDYDRGWSITADGDGNILVTGTTYSADWISGGWDTTFNPDENNQDAFVLKMAADGTPLWSTYLGGESIESGNDITTLPNGDVVVVGYTCSYGWVSGGWDTSDRIANNGFVVKLASDGTHVWSSYLKGSASGVATDSQGNILLTGLTLYSNWISGGWNSTFSGNGNRHEGYVVKLGSDGSHLWSSYLGGYDRDSGSGIAVDNEDNVLISGSTDSTEWISGGYDTVLSGGRDGFVVKLTPNGAHIWSTYLGGEGQEGCQEITLDNCGNILVSGHTTFCDWTSNKWHAETELGGYDGFAAKLTPAGEHVWSTSFGGIYDENSYDLAVDSKNNILLTGRTMSSNWISGGWNSSYNDSSSDAFIIKLNTFGNHVWSSYLGNDGESIGYGITVDQNDHAWVTGETTFSDFSSISWNNTYHGETDWLCRQTPPDR